MQRCIPVPEGKELIRDIHAGIYGHHKKQDKRNTKTSTRQKVELGINREVNKDHGSGTLIASLQALLSIAKSLEIFQSLRSLLTDSSAFIIHMNEFDLYVFLPVATSASKRCTGVVPVCCYGAAKLLY